MPRSDAFAAVAAQLKLVLVALLVAACGSPGTTTAPSAPAGSVPPAVTTAPTPATTADVANPVGMIVVGHSGLTGEGTGEPGQAVKDNSYATGTNPAVKSIYLRLVEAVPATEGHVSNQARGGARAGELPGQVAQALAVVPAPLLAIIPTMDSDVECAHDNVEATGAVLAKALAAIHDASPNTQILVVGQPGRPSATFIEAIVAADPSQKANFTWDDECTFYTADGKINPEGIANLGAAVDAYEAENARVCALVPNCHTDGGVRRAWVDKLEYFTVDFDHLNIEGQAAEAEQLWPVVQQILGL